MATANLSVHQKSLRYFHGPRMAKALAQKVFFLKTSKDRSKYVRFGGRDATMLFPVHHKRNWGTAAGTEAGGTATPRAPGFDEYSVALAELQVSMEISDRLIKATRARPDLSYVGNALTWNVNQVFSTAEKMLGIQIWGDGTGALAQTDTGAGAITATQFYVDNPGIERLEVGMFIEAYDPANKSSGGTNQLTANSNAAQEITDIDHKNNRVTIADTTGLSDNDWIIPTGHYAKTNLNGLDYHVDDGTVAATYQGLTRSGKHYTQAWVETTSGSLTETKMYVPLRRLQKFGIKEKSPYILTDPESQETLALAVLNRQRFKGTTTKGGFSAVSFETPYGTSEIVSDPLADPFKMRFLCMEDFGWGWMGRKGGQWFDEDGNMLEKKVDSTSGTGYATAYVATWLMYCQLICENPLNQALFSGYTA